jgi:hypothetical protein
MLGIVYLIRAIPLPQKAFGQQFVWIPGGRSAHLPKWSILASAVPGNMQFVSSLIRPPPFPFRMAFLLLFYMSKGKIDGYLRNSNLLFDLMI